MMLGERSYCGPTVQIPSLFSAADDSTFTPSPTANAAAGVDDYSMFFQADSLKALQRYLPSNSDDTVSLPDSDSLLPVDAHTCDHFRMYEFKVRKCTRSRSHDWTECPFAHPGEKARRRDPRKFHYSGTACPDFRKSGGCRRGDVCEFAHGVFECWLHPARYRTQPCKDGMACRRRVCFFAHSPDQLRVLSPRAAARADSPPQQQRRLLFVSSPTAEAVSPRAESPPMSPLAVNEMVASLRQLHLNNKAKSSFPATASLLGCCSSSPRGLKINAPSGYFSLPTTPTQALTRPGFGFQETWQQEEDMERVESGRDLRAKMFEKLSKENPLDRVDPNPNPDLGWVSELVNLN